TRAEKDRHRALGVIREPVSLENYVLEGGELEPAVLVRGVDEDLRHGRVEDLVEVPAIDVVEAHRPGVVERRDAEMERRRRRRLAETGVTGHGQVVESGS